MRSIRHKRPGLAWLAMSLWLAGMAWGGPGPAERQNEEDVEAFLRKEATRLTGVTARKGKEKEPESGRWRVSVAEIPVRQRGWIPDVDRHAAGAYTEVVRADAKRLALAGQHGRAIEELDRLTKEEDVSSQVLKDVVDYSYRVADYERSLAELQKILETRPGDPAALCNTAAVLIQQGNYAEALGLLEQIEAWEVTKPGLLAAVFFNRACAYSRLGNKERAVLSVYAAYKAHPQALALWMTDGQLDGIRGDPRMAILQNATQGMRRAPPAASWKGELVLKNPPEEWVQARRAGEEGLRLRGW